MIARDDFVLRAVEFRDAVNDDAACACAFDFRAHLVEEICEVHDFGFRGRALDDRGTLCERCGHHHVVCAEHGRALFSTEIDRRSTQFICEELHVAVLDATDGAESLKALEV
jgi:hypothetical protein